MKLFLRTILAIFFITGLINLNQVAAQADTTFWFAAPAVTPGHENKPIVFRVATYSQPADIIISEPANPAFKSYSFHLAANSSTTIDLTSQIDMVENKPTNSILNYGIKISATANVSAYYEAARSHNPEIFSLKGRYATGLSFTIPSQTIFNNKDKLNPLPNSGFVVVATEDSTTITVTLSNNDAIGHIAGVSFTIVLNKGQSYAVTAAGLLPTEHLGGSNVTATKPICITIFDDSVQLATHYDLAGDQIVSEAIAGSEFIIVRGDLNYAAIPNSDYYFVWATADNTTISINGSPVATINKGQSYKGNLSDASLYITTNNPVYVLQFTGIEDEVAETSLPAINCTGSQYVSFIRSTSEFFQLNLLCKATEINNFVLNGAKGIITASLFQDVPGTNGVWKAARISTDNVPNLDNIIFAGAVTSVANTSGLFHLGFLNGDKNTGMRLGYFSSYGIGNLNPVAASTVCDNENIQLQANQSANTTYSWTGPLGFTSSVYNPKIVNAQPANSGYYKISANVQGCGIFTDSVFITIYPIATATFFKTKDTSCAGSPKQLTVTLTGKAPWTMAYSDGTNTDTLTNILASPYTFTVSPTKTTTYSVTYLIDATPCNSGAVLATTSIFDTILVNPLPTATFSGADSLCFSKTKLLTTTLTGKSPWSYRYTNSIDTITINNLNTNPYSFTVSPDSTITYRVLSLIDANACAATLPINYKVNVYDKPTTLFSFSPEACLRDTIKLTDDSFDQHQQLVKWFWSFGDGTTDTVPNPIKQYSTANTYTISLYTVNNAGCYGDTIAKKLLVNPLPQAIFALSPAPYCDVRPVIITGNSVANVGAITSWHWSFGDGKQVDTTHESGFSHVYPTTGRYQIQLAVKNDKGCRSDTLSRIITTNPLPVAGFAVPEICLHDAAANFADTSSIADHSENQFTYSWSFSAATALPTVPVANYPTPLTSHSKNPSIKYNYVGNYFVSDTVTSNKGCFAVKTQLFIVNGANPVADFSVLQPSKLCSNDSVAIQDLSTVDFGSITHVDIYWDAVNTPSQKETYLHPTPNTIYKHRYPNFNSATGATRSYTISFVASSGNICGNAISKNCSLLPVPKVQFLPVAPLCSNIDSVQLSQATELSGIAGRGIFTGEGTSKTGTFYPVATTVEDHNLLYTFTTTAGCVDTVSQPVTVLPIPKVVMAQDLYALAGTATNLAPISANGMGLSFKWVPTNYLLHPKDSSTTLQIPELIAADTVQYSLAVTNNVGCVTDGRTALFILHQPHVPNVFSPNGDGINDTWDLKNLKPYPNAVVQVFDRNGQLVFQQQGHYSNWEGTYHGKPLPIGTYYYIVNTKIANQVFSGSVTIIR